MENLVQITDLKGFFGVDQSNSVLRATLENSIIPQTEQKYLIMLLGESLYNEFMLGINVVLPDQKWVDLLEGTTFEVIDINGNTIELKWLGLANMLKYLVYYDYSAFLQSQATSSGQIQLQPETGILVGINHVICEQFNLGVKLFGSNILEFNSGLEKQISFDFKQLTCYNSHTFFSKLDKELNTASAFNFLYHAAKANISTYPNWRFSPLEKINIYGI